MNLFKNLKEIEDNLPNGFHDALLEKLMIDLTSNSADLELQLFMGDPDASTEQERETYRRAILRLSDLVYFVIDAPENIPEPSKKKPLRIDGGDAKDNSNPRAPKPRSALPPGAFAYWFFVEQWNSFIHVAARSSTIDWAKQ